MENQNQNGKGEPQMSQAEFDELYRKAGERFDATIGIEKMWEELKGGETNLNIGKLITPENESQMKLLFLAGYRNASLIYEVLIKRSVAGSLTAEGYASTLLLHKERTLNKIDEELPELLLKVVGA